MPHPTEKNSQVLTTITSLSTLNVALSKEVENCSNLSILLERNLQNNKSESLTKNRSRLSVFPSVDKEFQEYKKDLSQLQAKIDKVQTLSSELTFILLMPFLSALKTLSNKLLGLLRLDSAEPVIFDKTNQRERVGVYNSLSVILPGEPQSVHSKFTILDLNYPTLKLSTRELVSHQIEYFNRIAPQGLSESTISRFLGSVAGEYQANPYHNFAHACSVVQAYYFMWCSSPRIQEIIDLEEMFVGAVAAICHDVGHRKF